MTILSYNGQNIEQRSEDGYVNATQMAAVKNKLIADWLRTEDCKRYTAALSLSMGIPIDKIIISKPGRPSRGGGTWIHPKLAIKLARWISVEFELWCDEHIKTLIETGSTRLNHQQDPEWQKARLEGKCARRDLTDAIKDYIERHSHEMSENQIKFMYSNASDKLNRKLFGKSAKQLTNIIGCTKAELRNHFTRKEVSAIHAVEEIATWLIDSQDMNPIAAIEKVITQNLYLNRFSSNYLESAEK